MKVSQKWLQKYFHKPLPSAQKLADALTFHAFEIESVEGDVLDVKVLPNRAADCLCHRGIAKELSAILDIPLKNDPLRLPLSILDVRRPTCLAVDVDDSDTCLRYMGALVKGVKIEQSPTWLKEALESVGQRSINTVVDMTNYVMLDIGQPLHAFDAGKLVEKDGKLSIMVRAAKAGERMTTLSGETHELTPSVLLITDANADTAIGIAGVKGGKSAEVTADTTDLVIEAANFDGTATRKAAQALKLFTDASLRFQNRPSPELAAYGMRDVLQLIVDIAGGEVVAVVDVYPSRAERGTVSVSLARINGLLGSNFSTDEVSNVFKRLDLDTSVENDTFTVTPPFERTDLVIPEDLIEEVGRTIGYDHIPPLSLPMWDVVRPTSDVGRRTSHMLDQARYRGIERVKDHLLAQGFTEVSTQSFTKKGDVVLANPLDKTKPALRRNLEDNLREALERAKQYAPLVLPPKEQPKLFEIGTVFPKTGETLVVATSEPVADLPEIEDDPNYVPKSSTLGAYRPFSAYPFIVRDIALWMPSDADEEFTKSLIREHAGNLLVRLDQFDRFQKGEKTSVAFRLVFQSMDRTLTDEEIQGIMANMATAFSRAGYEVR